MELAQKCHSLFGLMISFISMSLTSIFDLFQVTPPSLPRPPLHEQVKLVDYDDTQPRQSEENQGHSSAEMSSNLNSLQETLTERSPSARPNRRLSLSLNNTLVRVRYLRSRCIFSRTQSTSTRIMRSSVNEVREVIDVDTPDTATYDLSVQTLSKSLRPSTKRKSDGISSGFDNKSETLLNAETKGPRKASPGKSYLTKPLKKVATRTAKKSRMILRSTANSQQESVEIDSDSPFTKLVRPVGSGAGSPGTSINNQPVAPACSNSKRRSKRLLCRDFEAVDLDSVNPSPEVLDLDSNKLSNEDPPSIEVIPDTLSAISLNHSVNTNERRSHSDISSSSIRYNSDKLNNTPSKVSDWFFLLCLLFYKGQCGYFFVGYLGALISYFCSVSIAIPTFHMLRILHITRIRKALLLP